MNRKEIKRLAREQLGGKIFGNVWLFALLAVLLYSILSGVTSFIYILLYGPLTFGLSVMFLKQARTKEQMELGDLFNGFTTDFGGTLLLGLLETIFIALWSLLFVIPGIVKSYSYAMAFYIKADHPDYNWKTCITESRKMMKGHKWQLFVLDLSFIGWYIVGMLCLGVGVLWVEPYHQAARAQFYEALRGSAAEVA